MQGRRVTGLSSYTIAGRLGANYQINDQWAMGATRTTESSLDLGGGEMRFNFGPGLGQVTYRDAKPYLFSLAVRLNPFDPQRDAVVRS